MSDDEAWIVVLAVWRKIIQKGSPISFGRLLHGRIKQGYAFNHRFYEALQVSLLSDRYGTPTLRHHYVTVHGSEGGTTKNRIKFRTRNSRKPRPWSYFRVWGTGRGSRVRKQ